MWFWCRIYRWIFLLVKWIKYLKISKYSDKLIEVRAWIIAWINQVIQTQKYRRGGNSLSKESWYFYDPLISTFRGDAI